MELGIIHRAKQRVMTVGEANAAGRGGAAAGRGNAQAAAGRAPAQTAAPPIPCGEQMANPPADALQGAKKRLKSGGGRFFFWGFSKPPTQKNEGRERAGGGGGGGWPKEVWGGCFFSPGEQRRIFDSISFSLHRGKKRGEKPNT